MKARHFIVIAFLSILSSFVFALETKNFCVWDPVGRTGPVVTFYSDLIPTAQAWGLNIRFKAYTDEDMAANDFKAGRCEAVVLTSILSRQFVKFAGTMDAIGAINSHKGLELVLATLARPRAGKLMTEGNYEVVTTFPVGSMYAFVRDRSIDTIDDFAGKKLAILNGDPQMKKFADLAEASKVNVTLANFGGKFNRGVVDIVIMPALAYNTFELYKGLGKKGGIIDYRLYYGMLQTIAKRDQFPKEFGALMRNYMLTRMKAINKMVRDAEDEIPKKYWIKTNQFVKDEINNFSKRVRLALKDDDVNNSTALKLFWKIRCRLDLSRGECKKSPLNENKRVHEKLAQEQLAQKRLAQEQLAQKKLAQEQLAQKKLAQEQLAQQNKKQENLEQVSLAQVNIELEQKKIELEQFKRKQAKLELEKTELEQVKVELEHSHRVDHLHQLDPGKQTFEVSQVNEIQAGQERRRWWQYILWWL